MNPQRRIVVSVYAAAVVKPKSLRRAAKLGTVAQARIRQRWKAEYLEGDMLREWVDGFLTYDEAIGGLIRKMAASCESADAVIDLVAGLFSDLSIRSPDVAISRAVWIAARSRRRRHRGLVVEFPPTFEFTKGDRAGTQAPAPAKGGAA